MTFDSYFLLFYSISVTLTFRVYSWFLRPVLISDENQRKQGLMLNCQNCIEIIETHSFRDIWQLFSVIQQCIQPEYTAIFFYSFPFTVFEEISRRLCIN